MFTIDNEKYLLAQRISGVGIWLWTLKDNSLVWDQRLYEIYGVTPTLGGVSYQQWANLVHPEDLREIEQSASRLMDGRSDRFDHTFRAQKIDGTPLWIRTVANLYRDQEGCPHEILGANFDITKEVSDHKKVEFDKARLELALASSELGVWDWNIDEKILHWDHTMERIWGRTVSDLTVGSHRDVTDFWEEIHPEDKLTFHGILQTLKKSLGTNDFKCRLLGADNSIKYLKFKAKSLINESNKTTRIIGVCQDITEQTKKDLEDEHRRNLTIKQARLASVGQLAGGVGHEINNPLAVILGFTQKLLRKKELLGLNEEMLSGLLKIQNASNRIKKIVDGLRSLARTDDSDIESESNLNEVVETVISLVGSLLVRQGVYIEYIDPGIVCSIKVDRSKIQQIFMNLLTNASDAMADKVEKKVIEVRIEDRVQNWCLKVKDEGCGIPDDLQDKVFQSFFSTKGVGGGTGLGLAVSKSMAESWGGKLYFETQLDKGTSFFLEIPKATQEASKHLEVVGEVPLRVVLVTNDSEQQLFLQDYFNKVLHHVKILNDYATALKFLSQTNDIDLILVNSEINGMDGLNFIVEIGQCGYVKKALKIILGVGESRGIASRSRDFRFGIVDGFIELPLTEKDLNMIMFRLINRDPLGIRFSQKTA